MTNVCANPSTQLILLVGSNPLPNYLAACALRPSRVALMYTKETKQAKERLRCQLEHALGSAVTFENDTNTFVKDATCATIIRRVVDYLTQSSENRNVVLNYTGGTKVMAAHARMGFSLNGGRPEHASYLDEGGISRQPQLRFDDGRSKPLSSYQDVPLTLAALLALHGITHKPREPKQPEPTKDDAIEILHNVLKDVSLATKLYYERRRLEKLSKPNKAEEDPFRASQNGLTLSQPEFPTKEQLDKLGTRKTKESWFKQWYKFIGGERFEEWLGDQIIGLELSSQPEITVGVNGYRGEKKAPLEVDVAVVRGHRSYFISCTTDTGKTICKSKLFEIAVRSRQLGGDLARAALVCLAADETVEALRSDISELWGASHTTKVFGRSDVHAWSDCDGKQPNQQSLNDWLES